MRIYPVIDLKEGVVVRGIGGERASYRPIESRLVDSTEPLAVARAFRDRLGLERVYVADLDALGGAPPATEILQGLHQDGFDLMVDAGVRTARETAVLLGCGVQEIVAPLESLPDPIALENILAAAGPSNTVFSLDLKDGSHLGDPTGWPHRDADSIAREVYGRGVRRILFLDLKRVGSGEGPGSLERLARLADEMPDVEFLSGGGVRSEEDLRLLARAGVRGVLVASALHDGRITQRMLEAAR